MEQTSYLVYETPPLVGHEFQYENHIFGAPLHIAGISCPHLVYACMHFLGYIDTHIFWDTGKAEYLSSDFW
jgi:hypothetical protein